MNSAKDQMKETRSASIVGILMLWVLLICAGAIYASFVTLLGFSAFVSALIHGTLLVLLLVENMSILADLEAKEYPVNKLLMSEKVHMELIKDLTIKCMNIQKENEKLVNNIQGLHNDKWDAKWHTIGLDYDLDTNTLKTH